MTVITPRPPVVAGRRLFWEQEPSLATSPDAIIYYFLLLIIEQKPDEQQFFCTKTILLSISLTQYFFNFTRHVSDCLQTLQGKSWARLSWQGMWMMVKVCVAPGITLSQIMLQEVLAAWLLPAPPPIWEPLLQLHYVEQSCAAQPLSAAMKEEVTANNWCYC